MSLLEQLPKTIGSSLMRITPEGNLEIVEPRTYRLLMYILLTITILFVLFLINEAVSRRLTPYPNAILAVLGVHLVIICRNLIIFHMRRMSVIISPPGVVIANRDQPIVSDPIRNSELHDTFYAKKVVIHGHKLYHHVAFYSKRKDADEVRNIIDEFITQNRD